MGVVKYLGPPGCGKTTKGNQITGDYIDDGYHPDQIISTSFTNDAADEAADRVMKSQGLIERPQYFATEHAICKRILGIPSANIFSKKWLKLFSQRWPQYKYSWQTKKEEDERISETSLITLGDHLDFLEGKISSERRSPEEIYKEFIKYNDPPDGLKLSSLVTYIERKTLYKATYRLYTFGDMINETIKRRLVPSGAKILCVDEAQDCSPAQWELIKIWSEVMDETYLLGDFLQAVYEFSGADPDAFMNYPADHTYVLNQSYRLPKTVKAYAEKIIRTKTKYPFPEFRPRNYMGEVVRKNYYSIDWSNVPECFVLCRTRWQVAKVKKDLIDRALPFSCERGGESPLYQQKGIAYRTILKVGNKQLVSLLDLLCLIKYTSTPFLKHGSKTKIRNLAHLNYNHLDLKVMGFTDEFFSHLNSPDEIMNSGEIESGDREYLTKVFSKYGLKPKSDITITTMHGSKGRERPLVIVDPDLSRKSWNSLFEKGGLNSSEVLLQYVAATRAKEKLWILNARDKFSFPRVEIPEVKKENGDFLA